MIDRINLPKGGEPAKEMKNRFIVIPIIIMLVLLFSQTGLANVLDCDQVKIIIHISEQIEVDFDEKSLNLNLAIGVSSEKEFKIKTNSPLTVSFESKFSKSISWCAYDRGGSLKRKAEVQV